MKEEQLQRYLEVSFKYGIRRYFKDKTLKIRFLLLIYCSWGLARVGADKKIAI